ncbi:MAG TPA: hypothetical protein VIT42_10275 [Microlunatus sp.]
MTSRRERSLAALALATLLVAAGCSTPPWEQGSTASPAASTSPSESATPSATPTPAPTSTAKVENDLAKGSLKRTLTAGAAELKVTYWSTLDLGDWVPQVPKPLNVVASATLDGGAKDQNVYLSAVKVATTAYAADGSPQVLGPVDDTADVEPGYLITKPSSFQQVFALPAAPEGSTAVRISVTYELLIQSAPDAKTYLRQATSDSFQVPLVS